MSVPKNQLKREKPEQLASICRCPHFFKKKKKKDNGNYTHFCKFPRIKS